MIPVTRPLFNLTPENTAGEPKKTTLDLSTKIKLGDGTEVSIQDLMNAHQEAAKGKEKQQALDKLKDQLKVTFDGNATVEQRSAALREVLKFQGWSDADIESHLKEAAAEPDAIETPGGDDDVEDPKVKALEERLAKAEKQLEERGKGDKETHRRQLTDVLKGALRGVVDSNPKVQALIKHVGQKGGEKGEEAKKNFLASFNDFLDKETRAGLNTRYLASNGQYKEEWMQEEVEKAAQKLIGTYESMMGDLNNLGRSPEVVQGKEVLAKQPKPAPDWKPGVDEQVLDKQIDDFWKDGFERDLAEINVGDSKV